MTSGRKGINRWSAEENELLRQAVSRFENREDVDWREIAAWIPHRSNKDCRKRWVYGLSPILNKGTWEKAEDERLLQGVELYGSRWNLVSQVVVTRHPDQCSRRWRQSMNPNINRQRWSLVEDTLLEEAVKTYGRKWTEIVERYFPNRTPIAARQRYSQRFEKTAYTNDMPEERGNTYRDGEGPRLLWQAVDHTQYPQQKSQPSIGNGPGFPQAQMSLLNNEFSQSVPGPPNPDSPSGYDVTALPNPLYSHPPQSGVVPGPSVSVDSAESSIPFELSEIPSQLPHHLSDPQLLGLIFPEDVDFGEGVG